MIDTTHLKSAGVLIVTPTGPISDADITEWRKAMADQVDAAKAIKGLLIDTKHFPGYADMTAFFGHLGIIRDFHDKIEKLALVTDFAAAPMAEFVAKPLLGVDVKHFSAGARDAALAWLTA